MLLNCNSCQKKFVVPDSAITKTGRLVQCGSCGNKWTQHPIENTKLETIKALKTVPQTKPIIKKPKPKKNLYTTEYLRKKYGLVIENSDKQKNKNFSNKKDNKSSFGFYSYVIISFVLLMSLFGILNLTKEIIILKYPLSEIYITYLYEVIDVIKISITELVKQLKY